MFCCALLCVHSSYAITMMLKIGLVALLSLSSWCLVIAVLHFLAVQYVCLQFVSVVFPDHTDLYNVNPSVRYQLETMFLIFEPHCLF